MTWTYTGDPKSSEVDKYRFLIGDTNPKEPILQDEEIAFVLEDTLGHNTRLYVLFDKAATFFAKAITTKVGPIEEDPIERRLYYERKAAQYRMYSSYTSIGIGIGKAKASKIIFQKGMHDNV